MLPAVWNVAEPLEVEYSYIFYQMDPQSERQK